MSPGPPTAKREDINFDFEQEATETPSKSPAPVTNESLLLKLQAMKKPDLENEEDSITKEDAIIATTTITNPSKGGGSDRYAVLRELQLDDDVKLAWKGDDDEDDADDEKSEPKISSSNSDIEEDTNIEKGANKRDSQIPLMSRTESQKSQSNNNNNNDNNDNNFESTFFNEDEDQRPSGGWATFDEAEVKVEVTNAKTWPDVVGNESPTKKETFENNPFGSDSFSNLTSTEDGGHDSLTPPVYEGEAQRSRSSLMPVEDPDLKDDIDEDEFGRENILEEMSNFRILAKTIENDETSPGIPKSDSINIFTVKADPFDDDFFS